MKPYFDDGQVVIFHGDARELMTDAGAVFGGGGADLAAIVTDPPYGIAYQHGAQRGGRLMGSDLQTVIGDDEPFDPSHLLATGLPLILWGANHYADRLPARPGWLVWDKRDGSTSNDQSDCEIAWTSFLTTARVFSRKWWGAFRGGPEQAYPRLHMSQKPVALMTWCLDLLPPVAAVLDPYMGSGTTLVAARERGIKAVGIEIDERHCETAAARLSQMVLIR